MQRATNQVCAEVSSSVMNETTKSPSILVITWGAPAVSHQQSDAVPLVRVKEDGPTVVTRSRRNVHLCPSVPRRTVITRIHTLHRERSCSLSGLEHADEVVCAVDTELCHARHPVTSSGGRASNSSRRGPGRSVVSRSLHEDILIVGRVLRGVIDCIKYRQARIARATDSSSLCRASLSEMRIKGSYADELSTILNQPGMKVDQLTQSPFFVVVAALSFAWLKNDQVAPPSVDTETVIL